MTDFHTEHGFYQAMPTRPDDNPPEYATHTVFGDGGHIAGYVQLGASPEQVITAWSAAGNKLGLHTSADKAVVTIAEADQLAAAKAFVETWRELLGGDLVDSYGCSLTCGEAEAAAGLFRAFGDAATAKALLASHAASDDPGDDHNATGEQK